MYPQSEEICKPKSNARQSDCINLLWNKWEYVKDVDGRVSINGLECERYALAQFPLNIIQSSIHSTTALTTLKYIQSMKEVRHEIPPEIPVVGFIPHAAFNVGMRRGGKGLLIVLTFRPHIHGNQLEAQTRFVFHRGESAMPSNATLINPTNTESIALNRRINSISPTWMICKCLQSAHHPLADHTKVMTTTTSRVPPTW